MIEGRASHVSQEQAQMKHTRKQANRKTEMKNHKAGENRKKEQM